MLSYRADSDKRHHIYIDQEHGSDLTFRWSFIFKSYANVHVQVFP